MSVGHVFLVKCVKTKGAAIKGILSQRLKLSFVSLSRCVRNHCRGAIKRLFTRGKRSTFQSVRQEVLHRITTFRSILMSAKNNTPYFFSGVRFVGKTKRAICLGISMRRLTGHLRLYGSAHPVLGNHSNSRLGTFVTRDLRGERPFCSGTSVIFSTRRVVASRSMCGVSRRLTAQL